MGDMRFRWRLHPPWRLALVLGIIMSLVAVMAFRTAFLGFLGHFLIDADTLRPADVIVVMRGDEIEFRRSLTAATLFARRFGPMIYVSSALNDEAALRLRRDGIKIPSPQEELASVLMQSGVPCDHVLLDLRPPGGGTIGEMRRIRTMMESQRYRSALIVTSWYHSRRAARIARRILGTGGITSMIIAADDPIGPENWWPHRYVAIAVLEEFMKLCVDAFFGTIPFADDPALNAATSNSIGSSGCAL